MRFLGEFEVVKNSIDSIFCLVVLDGSTLIKKSLKWKVADSQSKSE